MVCRVVASLCLGVVLAMAGSAAAQQNTPHLAYVYPAGGQRGTTFEVKVGGQFLTGAAGASVSGGGVQVVVGEYFRPLTPAQATQLRDRMQVLRTQPASDAVQKELLEIRTKLATFDRNVNPVLAETVTLKVTIAPGAAAGKRELRLSTPQALSNPLVFCIGTLAEVRKAEPPPLLLQPLVNQPPASTANSEMAITLPTTVNGRIKPTQARTARGGQPFTPGDVDRYRFQASRGQQLVAVVSARELIPYLADAVPGWFQATLAIYDSAGKELAYDDDYRFNPDPVIHCEIPQDGDYVIEIKDALYRGREDFVYRISIGELPFITSIFPLGGRSGGRTQVDVSGWNLPAQTLTMDNAGKLKGIYPLSMNQGRFVSNAVAFAVDTLPEVLAKEPNDSQETAQKVQLPVIANGRIDRPGDWDVFAFEAGAGERIVAEVNARRLGSPLDSVLRLTDAAGRQVAFNDDYEDKGAGLETHHADSLISTTIPVSGTYYLYLGDVQRNGGAEYAYRLRISQPQPDFELRAMPSGINVRGGTNTPITVRAIRRDGFTGEIDLALKDAPARYVLVGARIPANQDEVRCTLGVPTGARGGPLNLSLEGRAVVQGRQIVRPAVPAEDMMQAFAYRHLVPAQEMKVVVGANAPFGQLRVLGPAPVEIPAGGVARIRVGAPSAAFSARFQLELNDPPDGIALQSVQWTQQVADVVIRADASKVKAGLAGNLIISIVPKPATTAPAQANRPRPAAGALPAIPFRIVAQAGAGED